MSFSLKNMNNYQITCTAYCPSGWCSSDKSAVLNKYTDKFERAISKFKDPKVIANKLIKSFDTWIGSYGKFEVESIKVIDKDNINIKYKNVGKDPTFFTNIYEFSVHIKCLK